MKKFISFFTLIFCFLFFAMSVKAQIPVTVTGNTNTTPNLLTSYTSLALALTDLNAVTAMTGSVTLTLTGGNSETAPNTGLTIGSATLNPVLSSTNSVTIISSGGAVTLNADVGGTGTPATAVQNGILKLEGADWITIDGLTFTDANAANPATMEYGIAFYKASATDGCQNNTIQNCSITLNRINNASGSGPSVEGSRGINVTNATSTLATTVVTVTSASGSNSNNKFYANTIQNCNYGIVLIGFADATPFANADTGNDVGGSSSATGNIILNYGGAPLATNPAAGVRTLAQYNENISYNTINSNDGSGVNHVSTLRGIFNNTALSASATITNNTVTVKSSATTSALTAIDNVAGGTAAGNTITISNNTVTGCTYSTATSGAFTGIVSSATAANVNINNNTISGNSTNATSGTTNLIQNSAAVTVSLNMNENIINGWTYNAATTSGTLNCVVNSGSTVTALVSISRNNIQNITHSVAGASAHNYINCSNPTSSSANINNNKFTNLIVNTTGTINCILRSGSMTATGSERCDSNAIVTAFSRTGASGTLNFYNGNASSVTGSTMINNLNNFSNVTVTGTASIAGWSNTEGASSTSGPSKTITNNTFNNLNASTGSVTGMSINFSGGPSSVANNIVSNITSTGTITGMNLGSSNSTTLLMSVSSNTIDPLTSTGASTVTGITSSSTLISIFKNKIYDLVANNAAGVVNGMTISGGVTVEVFNNLIGNLSAPSTNSVTDAVKGINMTSTTTLSNLNISYNTVYIQAQISTGANFSTSGVFHTASTTATTAQLNMKNNIFVNLATPAGTGNAAAYRRSSGLINTLNNYGSASNNNLFYAGTPGASNLIYSDGTSTATTISAYKNGVFTAGTIAPRDAQSVTENPNFLSTVGSSPNFLHIDPTIATQIESGAMIIAGINDDYDGDPRYPNPGYPNNINFPATAPDIGADEFAGIPADLSGPSIANTSFTDTCGYGNRNLNGVVITDQSGVAGGANAPRVYWNVNNGPWSSAATTSGSSPYDFVIGTAGLVNGDAVRFFVIAQDVNGLVSANPGLGLTATDVNNVTSFPTNPNLYNVVCTEDVGVTASNINPVKIFTLGKGYDIIATVKNFGTVTQFIDSVYYTDNGGLPVGPVTTVGPIVTNGTENVTFSGGFAFTPVTLGLHTLKIYTSLTGDISQLNDTLTVVVNVSTKITSFPYVETVTAPIDWTVVIENPVGITALWGISTATNPDNLPLDNAFACNFYNGSTGRREILRSPEMNISTLNNPVLHFYVAYETYTDNARDTVQVLVSTDGGVTFFPATTAYDKTWATNPSLATRPPNGSPFIPDSSIQWRHETVRLLNVAGNSNVVLGFRGKSRFGNLAWVDNIIVTSADSVCSDVVTTPAVYSCEGTLSLNFNTVGLSPVPVGQSPNTGGIKSTVNLQDVGINMNKYYGEGSIKITESNNNTDNPLGGSTTITTHDNQYPVPSNTSPSIDTNNYATTQDGSIFTPNIIAPDKWFTVTYDGNDYQGYANYAVSIDVSLFISVLDANKLYIVKRTDLTGKWDAINTTAVGTLLTASGLTDFCDFGVAGDSLQNPLPVELSSFVSTINGRNVTLNWTTATELNNSGFDVERRLSESTDWTRLSNVTGHGTSNVPNSYTYSDRNLGAGKYNYRLKQIDINGNFRYYNLSNEIQVGVPTKFDLSQNYPNPFNPSTKINYDLPFDGKVSVKVFDMSGKEVSTLVNEVKTAGYYTINFNASNLSSGVYFYRISAEANGQNFVSTKKMMLIK